MSRYHINHTTMIARMADQAHDQSNAIYNERLKVERADEVIFYDIFNQRFAEMIVRECALLCSNPVVVLRHWGLDSKSE